MTKEVELTRELARAEQHQRNTERFCVQTGNVLPVWAARDWVYRVKADLAVLRVERSTA